MVLYTFNHTNTEAEESLEFSANMVYIVRSCHRMGM